MIVSGVPNSAKLQFLTGSHTPAHTYKMALYDATTNLHPSSSTTYTTTGEVVGTGYTAGGVVLTGYAAASMGSPDNLAYISFSDAVWSNATITASGSVIYNTSGSQIIAIIGFTPGVYSSTNGTFTVDIPAAGNAAIIRIT